MNRRKRVKELETELRILFNQLNVITERDSNLHARHNKLLKRYLEIVHDLERISLKWKIKKILKKRSF